MLNWLTTKVKAVLINSLKSGKLTTMQETWTAWTLGRMEPKDTSIAAFFTDTIADSTASLYLRIPVADLRLLAFERIDEIAARGYESTREKIRAWWAERCAS